MFNSLFHILVSSKQLGCYFIVEGDYLLIFSYFPRNLKRLVHAMILKRPPGEWLGIIRFEFGTCTNQLICNT